MLRLAAIAVLVLPLFSVPVYSAGGSPPPDSEKCPAGKVRDKKTGKCVDAQHHANISYGEEYPLGVIPPGFYVFCNDHPIECEPVEPDVLTSDWMPTLERINREVNASITYKPEGLWENDIWTLSPKEGDCDDYTVTKRQKLIEAGVPRGAMRAAYVRTVDETDHIFLIVSTVLGDFVLDNNNGEVYDLERAMITKLSVQDASDPKKWWQVY